jgi:hypothetical protein
MEGNLDPSCLQRRGEHDGFARLITSLQLTCQTPHAPATSQLHQHQHLTQDQLAGESNVLLGQAGQAKAYWNRLRRPGLRADGLDVSSAACYYF